MIIDGRKMAAEVLARAKARAAALLRPPRVLALVANETPATKSYLAIKQKKAAEAGCVLELRGILIDSRPAEIVDMLKAAIRESESDAIIVQLPLPEGVDAKAVCDAIPPSKDADVLSSAARARFMDIVSPYLLPPVVGAVQEILEFGKVAIAGKKAVVIGAGFLVGEPVAAWLREQGAEVEVVTSESEKYRSLTSILKTADIIVSGAGASHFIKPDMLQQGVALVDAGTSESGGAIVGDADPACAAKCSLFTPVPGGVGPLAVAKLFENAVILAGKAAP